MKHWIEQRISRQVFAIFYLLIALITFTSIGTYLYTQRTIDTTTAELERISSHRSHATNLFETWQSMQYEMRGHVLLGEQALLDRARAAAADIEEQTAWFEEQANTEEEQQFSKDARLLFTIYSTRVMPALEQYVKSKERGEIDEEFLQMKTVGQFMPKNETSTQTRFQLNSSGAADMSASIVDMESVFTDYRTTLDGQETALRAALSKQLASAQWLWLLILLSAILILFVAMQPYIMRLTRHIQVLIRNSERLAADPYAVLVPVKPLKNEVGQLASAFTDMAESLIAQHVEINREREKTARIVHTMRDSVVFVELATNERYGNSALFDLYDCPVPSEDRHDLFSLAPYYEQFYKEIDDPKGLDRFTHRTKNLGLFDETFTYTMHGGKRTIHMYAEPIEIQQVRFGVMFVSRDITKEVETDQLKTDLVSTVSHELRTPLTSILGFAELLEKREIESEKRIKYAQMISRETRRLEELVNDLLDVQKMEAGIGNEVFTVERLFDLLSDVIEVHAGSTELHFFHFNCDESIFVAGDPARLKRVFSNIVNNAIKYSPAGGNITIDVTCDSRSIQISFKDEGLGVEGSDLERLFDKFYRAQSDDLRDIRGTGLGLAICKEIVERHGGTISAQSQIGEGTTMIVQLPTVK